MSEANKQLLDAYSCVGKPLTTGELRDMTWQADGGVHIWVKLLNTGAIYAAVTDLVDDLNVVALWCAESENDWLREHTYEVQLRK